MSAASARRMAESAPRRTRSVAVWPRPMKTKLPKPPAPMRAATTVRPMSCTVTMRRPASSTGRPSGIDTQTMIWNGVMPMPRAVSMAEAGTLFEAGFGVAGDRQQAVEGERDQRRREADAAHADRRAGSGSQSESMVSGPINRPKRAMDGTVWMRLRTEKMRPERSRPGAGQNAERHADDERQRQRGEHQDDVAATSAQIVFLAADRPFVDQRQVVEPAAHGECGKDGDDAERRRATCSQMALRKRLRLSAIARAEATRTTQKAPPSETRAALLVGAGDEMGRGGAGRGEIGEQKEHGAGERDGLAEPRAAARAHRRQAGRSRRPSRRPRPACRRSTGRSPSASGCGSARSRRSRGRGRRPARPRQGKR